MSHRAARVTRTTLGAITIVLIASACSGSGDDSGSSDTVATVSVPGSSAGTVAAGGPTYVVKAGDALSTIGDAYGVTAQQIADANEWSDGIAHVIQPGQSIRLPAGAALRPGATTVATTTTAPQQQQQQPTTTAAASAPSTTAAAAATTVAPAASYVRVPYPSGVNPSAPIDASWVRPDGSLQGVADGIYWAWEYQPHGDGVQFELTQIFLGDACVEEFGTAEEACSSDNNTRSEPTGTITMDPTIDDVTVCAADASTGDCYRISGQEYARLVAGGTPSPGAPAGYTFAHWPVYLTVTGGRVSAVADHYMS